jgi:hypothetical protein
MHNAREHVQLRLDSTRHSLVRRAHGTAPAEWCVQPSTSMAPTPNKFREIHMSKSRTVLAVSFATLLVASFGIVTNVEAKSSKCVAVSVPGHPGTLIVACTTARP